MPGDLAVLDEAHRLRNIFKDTNKTAADIEWCKHATSHAQTHGGKPWSCLPIPHDVITASATLDGLTATFKTATP